MADNVWGTGAKINWTKPIMNSDLDGDEFVIETFGGKPTRLNPLDALDLSAYTKDELDSLQARITNHLGYRRRPRPPKFTTVEEADAWMEETYG